MNKGYLFISNSNKPTAEQRADSSPVRLNFFSIPCIEAARDMGYELHVGVNRDKPEELIAVGYDVRFYDSHTYRSIFALRDNRTAYRNACAYLRNHSEIEVIHCNTPIGGVIGRICGRKFGCKVIYTAHGFHFYKGAPLFNRTILKWIEKWLAHYTDAIITINQEDFEAAQKFNLKSGGKVFKVPGVGVSTENYAPPKDKAQVLQGLGIPKDSFVCICMGDIVKRKNYLTAIQSIGKTGNSNVHYLICGRGPEMNKLRAVSKTLNIEKQIHFLGFRNDIKDLLAVSDVFLFSSLQEGLPRSTMEAMAAGLPCIVSDIRGNRDLIDNGKGGFLISPTDADGFALAIEKLITNNNLRVSMSAYNLRKIKDFDVKNVKFRIYDIYSQIL